MNPIEQNAARILKTLVESNQEQANLNWFSQAFKDLSPQDVSDAVDYLGELGALQVHRTLGTAPYRFAFVFVLSRGRFLYHETFSKKETPAPAVSVLPDKPLNPIGSPYGFTDLDWEDVALRKRKKEELFVVLGMQFVSESYDTEKFKQNLKQHLEKIVARYNAAEKTAVRLNFKALSMGLGEHLFNQIARDIISADIAFFETSDRNPNVMIEMGVALTWGTRVIPIKERSKEKPSSDISGQSWVDYENSCEKLVTDEFEEKMMEAIKRALGTKGR
ncbi:MAG: hypothetical protein M0022_01890 [Desulfobacteraceae bacterium]|nr:hypothetical protein [Desulfobacteraceae bacterium]